MTFCTTGVYRAPSVSDVLPSLVKFSYIPRCKTPDTDQPSKHMLGIEISTYS